MRQMALPLPGFGIVTRHLLVRLRRPAHNSWRIAHGDVNGTVAIHRDAEGSTQPRAQPPSLALPMLHPARWKGKPRPHLSASEWNAVWPIHDCPASGQRFRYCPSARPQQGSLAIRRSGTRPHFDPSSPTDGRPAAGAARPWMPCARSQSSTASAKTLKPQPCSQPQHPRNTRRVMPHPTLVSCVSCISWFREPDRCGLISRPPPLRDREWS